jgi:hypothetical protein
VFRELRLVPGSVTIITGFVLWFLPSVGQLVKYLGNWGMIAAAGAGYCALIVLFKWSHQNRWKSWTTLCARVAAVMMILVTILFATFYPIAKSGVFGAGSDRDDALDVALEALVRGSYPYYALTYLGNPPTPGPGALLLALPFFLLGTSALQNLFWLPFFLYYCLSYFFNDRTLAIVFFSVFILGCPGALQDFVTGGDYLVNAIYVGIAVDLVAHAYELPSSGKRWSACALLAMAISSRVVYLAVVPVLAAFLWQRRGLRAVAEVTGIIALIVFAINAPFYAHDPGHFAPLTLSRKLQAVPQQIQPTLVLPLASLLVACLSVFVRLDRQRLFGAIACAFVPVFIPPLIFGVIARGWTIGALVEANYLLPITVYGGMALMASLRPNTQPLFRWWGSSLQ